MAVRFGNDDTIIDCDDYAIELQMKALGDGYIVSFEIIGIAEYNGLFTTELRIARLSTLSTWRLSKTMSTTSNPRPERYYCCQPGLGCLLIENGASESNKR
jgi:hypothetical protein